jgi:AcrR family transcriptional regulator
MVAQNRPDGLTPTVRTVFFRRMERLSTTVMRDKLLDAAEAVVVRQGIANLTLESVAAEAGLSKGGLLHHFPTKDRLIEGMVIRCAEHWRACSMEAYEQAAEGPGRMARGLINHGLSDAKSWTEQCRRSSAAVFAALAQNPALIEPMRAAYADVRERLVEDGLPAGVGEAVAAAIDGLWLYSVIGLPVDQAQLVRMRAALEEMLARSTQAASPAAAEGKGRASKTENTSPRGGARAKRGKSR